MEDHIFKEELFRRLNALDRKDVVDDGYFSTLLYSISNSGEGRADSFQPQIFPMDLHRIRKTYSLTGMMIFKAFLETEKRFQERYIMQEDHLGEHDDVFVHPITLEPGVEIDFELSLDEKGRRRYRLNNEVILLSPGPLEIDVLVSFLHCTGENSLFD